MKKILNSDIEIKEISFDEFSKIFNIPARRPEFTPLSLELLYSLNIKMRNWEEALISFLKEL
jgi:dTDP-4-dehydrorhamnose reductase